MNEWVKRLGRGLATLSLCSVVSGLDGCRAQQPWPLWQKYAAKSLDSSGRIIDRTAEDKTTSEGQAYGMFFALVVNDQADFDKMLRWTADNLAGGDLTARLPAWSWGKAPDGSWKILDANPASDADLWLAYDLLEAGRLWKIDRYTKLGSVIAERIAHTEVALVPSVGTVLLPGPVGFHNGGTGYILNPSYMPPQLLARLASDDPSGPWGSIADALPQLLGAGSGSGFAMDWVVAGSTLHPSATPKQLSEGKSNEVAIGSYDAIRVYLWLGTADRRTRGVEGALPAVGSMGVYLKTHVTPPMQVDMTGKVLNDNAPPGFSAAVLPYLLATGYKLEAKMQMDRLGASFNPSTGLYGRGGDYYDQNLSLFSTGWIESMYRFDRDGRLKLKWK